MKIFHQGPPQSDQSQHQADLSWILKDNRSIIIIAIIMIMMMSNKYIYILSLDMKSSELQIFYQTLRTDSISVVFHRNFKRSQV